MASTSAKKAKPNDDVFVDLVVGGYPYRATRALLLASPYFEALFSGRWKCENSSEPINIPDMDGRIFFYVLYFLRLDELPRTVDGGAHRSLLPKEDIDGLQEQADFLGLTRLVDLCKKTNDVLKGLRHRVGDLDLTDISDFAVKIESNCTKYDWEFEFTMDYTYKCETKVKANGICEDIHGSYREYLNGIGTDESFESAFSCLKKLIEEETKDEEELSVTRLLDQVPDIPPETRLWYAFVVQDMIEYFAKYKSFDDGEFIDGKGFLFSETSSSFVTRMKSVK